MSREFKEPCPEKRKRNAEAVRRCRANRISKDPEGEKARKRDYDRKAMYGVTVAEITQHLADQGGVCSICQTPLDVAKFGTRSRDGKPHVDHCHTTGNYRGILCHMCNLGSGHFRDSPAALSAAIKYLTK